MDIGSLVASLGVDTKGLDRAEKRMSSFGDSAISTFGKIQKSVFSLQGALVSLGIGFSVNQVKKEAAEYQTALNDMAKVTDVSLKKIDKSVRSLAPGLGNSTELMRGYYQVISAGVTDPVKALETLITASKTAKVAHVDQSMTVMALTKLMAGYAGQIKNTAMAADLLLSIEKQGQTQVSELVPVIGSAATMSRTAGLAYQEMGAALSLITQTAGSTAEAVTQLNAVNTALLRPTEQMTEIFKEYGGAVNFMKQEGLESFLKKMQEASKGSAEALSALLGGRKEATMGVSALLSNLEGLRTNIEAIEKGTGGLERAWQRLELTFEAVEEELGNKIINQMITLGTKVLPALTSALQFVNREFDNIVKIIKVLFEVGAVFLFSRMAVVITFGLVPALKLAVRQLFLLRRELALIAGYEIGKYLYKEFETVRLLSVGLVDGIIKGWLLIREGAEKAFTAIGWAWDKEIYSWKMLYADFLNMVASGLAKVPFLGDRAAQLSQYAAEYAKSLGGGPEGLEGRLNKITEKLNGLRETHRKVIDGLVEDTLRYGKTIEENTSGGIFTPEEGGALPPPTGGGGKAGYVPSLYDKLLDQLRFQKSLLGETETVQRAMTLARQNDIAITNAQTGAYTEQFKEILSLVEEYNALEIISDFNSQYADLGKSQVELERERIREQAKIWEMAGADKVQVAEWTAEKLKEISGNEFSAITEFGVQAAHNIQDAFSDFFYDAFTGELDSAKDYFKAFTEAITRTWANMLSQMLMESIKTESLMAGMKGIGGFLSGVFGGLFGGATGATGAAGATSFVVAHAGGEVGFDSFPTRTLASSYLYSAPRLHNGLMPDEFPAILQRGETVIPRGKQETQKETVNYNIVIQAVDAKSFSDLTRRNPQAIIGPIVSAINDNDPSLRTSIRTAIGR